MTIPAGDTVIIGVIAASVASGSFSVTDAGGNTYSILNQQVTSGAVQLTVFSTGAGIAKASSGAITVSISPAALYGFVVLDAFNVGSFGQLNIPNSATSTTPTNVKANFLTTTTQDNNNIVATFINYCPSAAVTISANTGTLQASGNGGVGFCGGGVVTNTSATPAAVTTSATLSVSKPWVTSTLELRSVQATVPTVYFPYQSTPYYYSSGLTFTLPVTLKGDPGSVLWYTGTADAIDIGPTNLTGIDGIYQFIYYTIDGLTFKGGGSMTNGIFVNNWVGLVKITNNQFLNFGNASAWAVWLNGNTDDLYMSGNHWLVNDGATNIATTSNDTLPRHWLNVTTNSTPTTIRFVNNSAACINGLNGNVGCSYSSFDTPLISAIGLTHDFSHNNFMGGFCPAINLGNLDNNTKISYNHFETQLAGCYSIASVSGVSGLTISNNYFRSGGSSPVIGPRLVGDVLAGMRIRDNVITALPAGQPVVFLNNLAGQINNLASGNMCNTTSVGPVSPCPIIHTAGGNITQWNGDQAPPLTFAAGTTASYTFLNTYTVPPPCTIPPNIPGTATTLTITTLSTTTLTITASAANSATVHAICDPSAQ